MCKGLTRINKTNKQYLRVLTLMWQGFALSLMNCQAVEQRMHMTIRRIQYRVLLSEAEKQKQQQHFAPSWNTYSAMYFLNWLLCELLSRSEWIYNSGLTLRTVLWPTFTFENGTCNTNVAKISHSHDRYRFRSKFKIVKQQQLNAEREFWTKL